MKRNLIIKTSALAMIGGLALCGGFFTLQASAETVDPLKPTMTNGASVRLMEGDIKDGIRFEMTITKEQYDSLNKNNVATSGIILTPTQSVTGEITIDSQQKVVADTTDDWFIVYDNQEKTQYHYASRAVLVDIGSENWGTAVSARGYLYDGTTYHYTDYTVDNNSRSMKDVAQKAIEKTNDFDQLQSLYKYLSVGTLYDGYVTGINTTSIMTLPENGEERPEYVVTNEKGEEVEVLNGNKVTMGTPGVYTATMGDFSLTYTVYSEADWAKVILPCSSEQFEGVFGVDNNPGNGTFKFDANEKAYRYTHIDAAGVYSRCINDGSFYYQRIANYLNYNYYTFKIKYNARVEDLYFWQRGGTTNLWPSGYGNSGPMTEIYLGWHHDAIIETETNIPVTWGELTTGKWYTFYIATSDGQIVNTLLNRNATSGVSDFYFKDFKFADEIPNSLNLLLDSADSESAFATPAEDANGNYFKWDETEKAYHYYAADGVDIQRTFEATSDFQTKVAHWSKFGYYALEIKYNSQISDLHFPIPGCNQWNDCYLHAYAKVYNSSGELVHTGVWLDINSYCSKLQTGEWYTLYIPATGQLQSYFPARNGNSGIADFYIKNLRLVKDLPNAN